MTIDEAIAQAREVASRKFDDRVHCIRCAEEHEQLAEWLEELKMYRKSSYGELHDIFYNKAINDFIKECDKFCGYYSGKNRNLTREDMLMIAEKLKKKESEIE